MLNIKFLKIGIKLLNIYWNFQANCIELISMKCISIHGTEQFII